MTYSNIAPIMVGLSLSQRYKLLLYLMRVHPPPLKTQVGRCNMPSARLRARSLSEQYEEALRSMDAHTRQMRIREAENEEKRSVVHDNGTRVALARTYGTYPIGTKGEVVGTYRSISLYMCSRVKFDADGKVHGMPNYMLERTVPIEPAWEV